VKIVSKLKLEIPLACRGCVAPARGILLGLASCLPLISPKADFFSGFLVVIFVAANHNILHVMPYRD
jgi:hypothetical protein